MNAYNNGTETKTFNNTRKILIFLYCFDFSFEY